MVKDILINDSGDLVFTDGDFTVGNSDLQHVVLITNIATGNLKQYPLQGVGIGQYLGSSGQIQIIKRSITTKLEADGFNNVAVTVSQKGEDISYSVNADRFN